MALLTDNSIKVALISYNSFPLFIIGWIKNIIFWTIVFTLDTSKMNQCM